MSRALDKGVKVALKNGNHERVFEEISSALIQAHGSLLEIELLGQSHIPDADTTLLQDVNAIAIPKLRLVQAFIVARRILNEHLVHGKEVAEDRILRATATILLMDAEHLTAANTRKRLISNNTSKHEHVRELLGKEKYFIDSLLTSRLHRHTKSPVLWSHRRWLTAQLGDLAAAGDLAADIRDVVFVSAERHPRNYYAWCHARQLVALSATARNEPQRALLDGPSLVADAKRWCFSHHDDVSGWMFLLFLLRAWTGEAAGVFSETLQLTESFHWRNESVWYFLRNVVATGAVDAGRKQQFEAARTALRAGTRDGSLEQRALDQAASWVKFK
ncbi:hypothetical protein JDV02_002579 [Purpureocillium takamizusanense]|uniref:Protein prenyltransferase n=1 Tax=Purpureocillium takamizusanense TaxID=2060973 RepID=A0A9Q8QAK6_9HYPO|nr:uncharacterized protein JDV02_002579 [Purpureocillium takamizusanense]UNI16110.1 hypothetical protein JDV02_002579 [Purpureocillium takamizusanense]